MHGIEIIEWIGTHVTLAQTQYVGVDALVAMHEVLNADLFARRILPRSCDIRPAFFVLSPCHEQFVFRTGRSHCNRNIVGFIPFSASICWSRISQSLSLGSKGTCHPCRYVHALLPAVPPSPQP